MNVFNNSVHNHQKIKMNKSFTINTIHITVYCYFHTMQHYSPRERNKSLIHVTIWMNVEGIILSERSQFQKLAYYMMLHI